MIFLSTVRRHYRDDDPSLWNQFGKFMSNDKRYTLSSKIAKGGMAEIYLGSSIGHDGFQRVCAIKRILPHFASDEEYVKMFRDEAHICKSLQHANIVRVEGFEEVEGSYAIIMEFVNGSDLRTVLHAAETAKTRIPVPMACYIIAEAARGLHFAHTKIDEVTRQPLGIVHRDISPQNLLVSYEGEVKVTDFGIADADNKMTETRPGIVKGKYSYMSPEQIQGKRDVDARTDVFALTIVLWEMLAMRRLFNGANEADTIQRVRNCKIDLDIRQLNKEVDEDLDKILKLGLAKDVKKRFKSAGELERALRQYLATKFPEFTQEDLGNFLKKHMESRRNENAEEIKKTLTSNNRIAPKSSTPQKSSSLNIEFDGSNDSLSIAARPNDKAGKSPIVATGAVRVAAAPSHHGQRLSPNRTRMEALPRGKHSRREKQSQNKMLLALAVLVLGILVSAKLAMQLTARPAKSTLVLRTQPTRVKVTINNKPYEKGKYLVASSKTPLNIKLPAGEHSVTIARPGYQSLTQDIKIDDGEKIVKDDLVLQESSPVAAVRIRLSKGSKPVTIDIDNGYFVGKITNASKGFVTPDLFAGKTYTIVILDENKKDFTCKYKPKAANWRNPIELEIDRRRRRCVPTEPQS